LHAFVSHVDETGLVYLQLPSNPSYLKICGLEVQLTNHCADTNVSPFIDLRHSPVVEGEFFCRESRNKRVVFLPRLCGCGIRQRRLRAVVACRGDLSTRRERGSFTPFTRPRFSLQVSCQLPEVSTRGVLCYGCPGYRMSGCQWEIR
jgi:hypothetical protein